MNSEQLRWWDGSSWTEHLQPAAPQQAPQSAYQPVQQPMQQHPHQPGGPVGGQHGAAGSVPPPPQSSWQMMQQQVGGGMYPTGGGPGGWPAGPGYGQAGTYAAAPVGFGEAVRRGFTLWTMKGRASRSEYWYFALFTILVSFALGIVQGIVGAAAGDEGAGAVALVGLLVQIASSVILFKIAIRRYHDTGRGGGVFVGQMIGSVIAWTAAVVFLIGAAFMAISEEMTPETEQAAGGTALIGLAFLLVGIVLNVWTIVTLARKGQVERNRFDDANAAPRAR